MESSPRAADGAGQWRWVLGAGRGGGGEHSTPLVSLLAEPAAAAVLQAPPELAEEFGAAEKTPLRPLPRRGQNDASRIAMRRLVGSLKPRQQARRDPRCHGHRRRSGGSARRQRGRGSMVSLFWHASGVVLAGLPRLRRVGESGRERGGSWVGGGGSGEDGAAERSQLVAALPNCARLRRREARFCTPTKAITNIIAGGEVAATRADMENRPRRCD